MASKKSAAVEFKAINGVTLKPGVKCFVVRNRVTIDPLPADWRENTTDVTEAKYVGFSKEDDEYIFDDGRTAEGTFLAVVTDRLEDFIWNDEAKAKTMAKKEAKVLGLEYARDDYEVMVALHAFTAPGANGEAAAKESLSEAGSRRLGDLARGLGQSSFSLFRGFAADLPKKRKALLAHRGEMKAKDLSEVHKMAKATIDRLLEKWGDDVKITNEKAAEIAKEEAKKAKEEAAKKKAAKEKEKEKTAAPKTAKRTAKKTGTEG